MTTYTFILVINGTMNRRKQYTQRDHIASGFLPLTLFVSLSESYLVGVEMIVLVLFRLKLWLKVYKIYDNDQIMFI